MKQLFYDLIFPRMLVYFLYTSLITVANLIQVRTHMSRVGVRSFQELVGRTDLLKVREKNDNYKARLLNLAPILKNALHMRPGVDIRGGSKPQVMKYNLINLYKTRFLLMKVIF